MGISSTIRGSGNKNSANVNSKGALSVIPHMHPVLEGGTHYGEPYRVKFSDSGTTDMAVNGSVTSVEYIIEASDEDDIFIKTIVVEIEDGGSPNLNKFGDLAALATGVQFEYQNNNRTVVLHEGVKTNKEFIKLGTSTPGFGDGANAFLADVSGGAGDKSYIPIIDLSNTYGLFWGIRLRKGSQDKLLFRINDDLSALTLMEAIAYGQTIV